MAEARASRGFGRILAGPLLVLALLSVIIYVGISFWEMNAFITNFNNLLLGVYPQSEGFAPVLAAFDGNGATLFLILFGPIAGVVAIASHIFGLHHLAVWTNSTLAAAQAAAWIGFGLLWLPFYVSCKQISLENTIPVGDKTQTISAFVIIATFVHFAYTLALYL